VVEQSQDRKFDRAEREATRFLPSGVHSGDMQRLLLPVKSFVVSLPRDSQVPLVVVNVCVRSLLSGNVTVLAGACAPIIGTARTARATTAPASARRGTSRELDIYNSARCSERARGLR